MAKFLVTSDYRVIPADNLITTEPLRGLVRSILHNGKIFDSARAAYDHAINECDSHLRQLEREKGVMIDRKYDAIEKVI